MCVCLSVTYRCYCLKVYQVLKVMRQTLCCKHYPVNTLFTLPTPDMQLNTILDVQPTGVANVGYFQTPKTLLSSFSVQEDTLVCY